MRPSPFIFVALLLAGCSADDVFDFSGLPSESYWVVTRTFDAKASSAGVRGCESKTLTEPALLRFTAPDVVTLSTLRDQFLLNDGATTPTGKVTPDGALAFYGHTVEYSGRFEDADHFTVTGRMIRSAPGVDACPARVTAYRYPGPRMCEVTTEDEEAALAARVREVVAASNLPHFREVFVGPRLQLLWYALQQTAPGAYAQAGTNWTLTAPSKNYTFTTDDGLVLTMNAEMTSAVLRHPAGGELTAELSVDGLRLEVDGAWAAHFDIQWSTFAPYSPGSIGLGLEYRLSRYETPMGQIEWHDAEQRFILSLDEEYRIDKTARQITLSRTGATKTWRRDEAGRYCPAAGHGLYAAFPNVLEEIFTFCATTPLYEDRVECMLVGP